MCLSSLRWLKQPGLLFAPLRERFRGRGPGVLCFVLARAPHWSRLEGRRKDYDGQTADPTGLRVASAFANADAWQPSCGDRVCWHLHHAEATSPSTSTALRHTPDGGGTGVGQVPAAAIGGLRVGDRARGQLHHAEAVLLRAGKHQPTSQVPAAALGGLCAGAWYASTGDY